MLGTRGRDHGDPRRLPTPARLGAWRKSTTGRGQGRGHPHTVMMGSFRVPSPDAQPRAQAVGANELDAGESASVPTSGADG